MRRWVEAGLVSPEQADAIVRFEEGSDKARWSKIVLRGFLLLGACVVSIGIISLVAANWDEIPEGIKLGAAFVFLGLLAAGSYWAKDQGREITHEALSTVLVLGCLACIGLVAQVFHTGGEPYQAVVFWLVISFPLAGLASRMFLPGLWVVGLLACFFVLVLQDDSWWSTHFLTREGYHHGDNLYPLFAITALWTLGLAGLCSRLGKLARFATHFRFWGLVASLVAVVAGDLYCSFRERASIEALYPAFALLPLALVGVLADAGRATRREKLLLIVLLCLSIAVYLPSLALTSHDRYSRDGRELGEIIGAIYALAGLVLAALLFVARRKYWLFNAMTILIGVRFLIVYFQVFKDLSYTGVGLVVSGLLIIGMAVAWFKFRSRLETWAKRFAP